MLKIAIEDVFVDFVAVLIVDLCELAHCLILLGSGQVVVLVIVIVMKVWGNHGGQRQVAARCPRETRGKNVETDGGQ